MHAPRLVLRVLLQALLDAGPVVLEEVVDGPLRLLVLLGVLEALEGAQIPSAGLLERGDGELGELALAGEGARLFGVRLEPRHWAHGHRGGGYWAGWDGGMAVCGAPRGM